MLPNSICVSRKSVSAGILLLACLVSPALGQVQSTFTDVHHDVSRPLRDMAVTAVAQSSEPREDEPARLIPIPPGMKPASDPDSVLQRTSAKAPTLLGATPGLNFEGLGTGLPGFVIAGAPPDTNGAAGLTQYVQWVNLSFAVFDKSTGAITFGPVAGNSLWQGFGGNCETNNDGDPIVLYDKLADRWVFSQFSVRTPGVPNSLGPFFQCVAVSTSPDATGTYNRYSFQYSSFDDYPKMGVWPDAYYVTFNMFAPPSFAFAGADACAYDRNAMLAGLAATQICFQQGSSVGGLLPADVDGHIPPPAGSPDFMVFFGANNLNLFKFHADFATPANSSFAGPTVIPVAPFTPVCGGATCVQQPNTTTLLDSLADRLMYRLAYRNFGDHESLVVNHSVSVGATANTAGGVRWYELQNPNGTPVVAQQSTYAPDTSSFRWMGSIAMDQVGDVALGYTVASSTIFPSAAVTARAAGDPASTMGPETIIVNGTGSQTTDSFGNALTRWGDYSAMQIDPSDDCTFWYTSEYLATTGIFNWNTRIASFKFSGCDKPDLTVTSSHTGNFTQGQNGAVYTLTATNSGGLDTTGTVTLTDTLPSGLTATAIAGTGWTCDLPTLTCTRGDVLASRASYPAIALTVKVAASAAGVLNNSVVVSGGGELITANDSATDLTTIIQLGPDPTIAKSHTGTFIQGQTGTYTILVTNIGLSALDGSVVTVTDSLPAGLSGNAVSGSGWSCVIGPPVKCTRTDALASNTSYPAITLNVNVANGAPVSVVNSATVSGGGETNTLNDSASDPTSIAPPPADLTITKTHTGNFQQGQSFAAYTITVSNVGPSATTGLVSVTDTLPTGLTFANMFGTGWNCNLTTCTRSDALPATGSYSPITLSVNVAGNAPASVTNTAAVSGGGEFNTANDTANDVTTITPNPDLAITKTHVGDFTVGQNGIYTITVSNAGGAPTVGAVSMNDFLPSGMTATAITATGWSCSTVPTFFLSCTRSDALSASGSYPAIVVTVQVNGAFTSPEINNASVSGGGELNFANDNASDSTIVKTPVLAIAKSHSPASFTVGQTGIYTINVSNTGTAATATSTPVNVSDFLPAGMTATDLSASTGWTCSAVPTTFVNCSRSDALAPATSYPAIVMTVRIDGSQSANVTNNANVSGGGDLNQHNATDPTPVNGPLLSISKTHAPATFVVGQTGTYTITVGNTGITPTSGSIANPVSVNDFLPQGMTATDLSASTGWTCSAVPTTFVTCTRSDVLATGTSYPAIVMAVRIDGSGSPTQVNQASVTGGGDLSQHTATDPTPVTAPVLSITKSHLGNFTIGQTGDYTITVSNTGAVATQGTVSVSDFLPFGMTATAINATGWTCPALPTQFVNCSRADVLAAAGSYPPIVATVSIDSNAQSNMTNTANVTGGGDFSTHFANDPTTINVPDLSIAGAHSGNFFVGQVGATYTVNISNVGTTATAGGTVNMNDTLLQGLTATAASGTGWSCTSSFPSTVVFCTRLAGTLAPGTAYPPITITLNVAPDAPSSVTSILQVNGIGDANFSNNLAFDNLNISRVAVTSSGNGSATVTAGNAASFVFSASLATNPPVGTVTFSATGLPPSSNASFTPTSLTVSGPVALTINTSGNGHVAALRPTGADRFGLGRLALFFPFAGVMGVVLLVRTRRKSWLRPALAISFLTLFLGFAGCGGGGGTPPPPPAPVVTPAGTYVITMTATSSNLTIPSVVTKVTLTVQ